MKSLFIFCLFLPSISFASGCFKNTEKLVGVINSKSAPESHVRHCEIHLYKTTAKLKSVDWINATSFLCDSERIYNALSIGKEVIGNVTWISIYDKKGNILCRPQFELTGIVKQI
jgi:hypothetical protein